MSFPRCLFPVFPAFHPKTFSFFFPKHFGPLYGLIDSSLPPICGSPLTPSLTYFLSPSFIVRAIFLRPLPRNGHILRLKLQFGAMALLAGFMKAFFSAILVFPPHLFRQSLLCLVLLFPVQVCHCSLNPQPNPPLRSPKTSPFFHQNSPLPSPLVSLQLNTFFSVFSLRPGRRLITLPFVY